MIDGNTFRVISKLASGYDPNTGMEIGENGIRIDQNMYRALSRVVAELRRTRYKKVFDLTDDETELFNKLREYRNRKSHELGLPAFRIAPDEALAEIAMVKPRSVENLNTIYGIRQKRIELYGDDFIAVVKEHLKAMGLH